MKKTKMKHIWLFVGVALAFGQSVFGVQGTQPEIVTYNDPKTPEYEEGKCTVGIIHPTPTMHEYRVFISDQRQNLYALFCCGEDEKDGGLFAQPTQQLGKIIDVVQRSDRDLLVDDANVHLWAYRKHVSHGMRDNGKHTLADRLIKSLGKLRAGDQSIAADEIIIRALSETFTKTRSQLRAELGDAPQADSKWQRRLTKGSQIRGKRGRFESVDGCPCGPVAHIPCPRSTSPSRKKKRQKRDAAVRRAAAKVPLDGSNLLFVLANAACPN